jgi:hypothetical protein
MLMVMHDLQVRYVEDVNITEHLDGPSQKPANTILGKIVSLLFLLSRIEFSFLLLRYGWLGVSAPRRNGRSSPS